MPLAFKTQRVNLNSSAYFHFDGPIGLGQYVVGASMFSLYYPNLNAHWVHVLDMSLSHGSHDEQTIYVTVNGNMEDDSHNVADPRSGAEVTVVAWVGTSDLPTVVMENVNGVSQSSPYAFDIPPNALEVFTFLSGIHLALPDGQKVTSYGANCVSNVDPINKRVAISGDSQLNGVHGTVDVGFLVLTSASSPFQVITASEPNDGKLYSIPFRHPINAACSLLTSFSGDYYGGSVVLMAADASIFVDDPFPVSAVTAGFGVDIVDRDHGTINGGVNATVIALNSPSSAGASILPTHRSQLFGPGGPGAGLGR